MCTNCNVLYIDRKCQVDMFPHTVNVITTVLLGNKSPKQTYEIKAFLENAHLLDR